MKFKKYLAIIGPGILIAATGVGAGDLATAAFTGAKLGMMILWVVVLGAFFKFILNEGLLRWQLVTGETILEGALNRFGRTSQYFFLFYFLIWSFMVCAALMSACGVAAHAMFPFFTSPTFGKIFWGIIHSIIGLIIVRVGGYAVFEKIMGICIGVMFFTVVLTAILLQPNLTLFFKGLIIPKIPELDGAGLGWTIALMGGIGGTVTILCYGYWIREEGRFSVNDLKLSRLDLASGYIMTAIFGIAMVVIGSTIQIEEKGASLIIDIGAKLSAEIGILGKWAFLVGAWGAIFSSLLGVWQSLPYLFDDMINLIKRSPQNQNIKINTSSKLYRGYLYALAFIPMFGLWVGFARMQKLYAIIGALFLPMLAITLILLNGSRKCMGTQYKNRLTTVAALLFILIFFIFAGYITISNIINS